MAATNRYVNVTASFTPSGGSPTPLPSCKGASYDEGVSVIKESADGDMFPTVSVNDFNDPTISIELLDAFLLVAQLAGQKGTLVVTVADAYNKVAASGGGKTITMSNAQIQDRKQTHRHRAYSGQALTFGCISTDGLTHPVAVSSL